MYSQNLKPLQVKVDAMSNQMTLISIMVLEF